MWESMLAILDMQYAGITVLHAGLALFAILAGLGASWVLRLVLGRVKGVTEKARFRYADILVDALMRPATWATITCGFWIGATLLSIPPEHEELHKFLGAFFKGGSILLVIWFAIRFTDGGCLAWSKKVASHEAKTDRRMVQFVRGVSRVILIVLGAILFMQNLGYSVGSLLAGLGLGGAALALASKDLLSSVFGSVAIFWDRSFSVGDWVEIGDVEGNVEEVGLRNTKIRTFSNSLVTMPNSSLMTGSINNWTRMKKRRAQVRLHLSAATAPEKLLELVLALRALLAHNDKMVPGDAIVMLDTIDEYSFCVFIQFFTLSVVWTEHLEAKQEFLLKTIESMTRLGVELATLPGLLRLLPHAPATEGASAT